MKYTAQYLAQSNCSLASSVVIIRLIIIIITQSMICLKIMICVSYLQVKKITDIQTLITHMIDVN